MGSALMRAWIHQKNICFYVVDPFNYKKINKKKYNKVKAYKSLLEIKDISSSTDNIIEILEQGSLTANEKMLSTKEMLSKKGRSSKLGERSRGHIDPGAASSALIFKTFYEATQNL